MVILKLGSKGNAVKEIQKYLNITQDGDFGPKTEAAVKQFQKENGLNIDGVVGPITYEKLKKLNTLNITKGYINTHITRYNNRTIKYIAIHYTASTSSKKGKALAIRNVFLQRNASADFVVDDETIVQINPNLKNYYTWSVGDAKNKYTGGGQLYGKATNKNTISIEICSNLKAGYNANYANHDGWYFTKESIDNALKLTKYLMKTYNIPKENVVRHFDITGKLCPGIIGWNTFNIYSNNGSMTKNISNDDEWKKFKSKL